MNNKKKQSKDKLPANMPTGLNMTLWQAKDAESIIAASQLRLDFLQNKLLSNRKEIRQLKRENENLKKQIVDLTEEFKVLKEKLNIK